MRWNVVCINALYLIGHYLNVCNTIYKTIAQKTTFQPQLHATLYDIIIVSDHLLMSRMLSIPLCLSLSQVVSLNQ